MISKTDILKMVKQVHRHSRGLPPRRLIYPAREWGIGVVVCTVLVAVAGVFSVYQYIRFDTINEQVVPAPVSTVRYQDNSVERTLELYQVRSDRFAEVRGNAPAIVVPASTSTASSTGAFAEPTEQPEGDTSSVFDTEDDGAGGTLTVE